MTAAVDILMATYNGERYVAEQIESIQAQTFGDWRLLVSDDCSTDGTLAVIEAIATEDPRIQIVSQCVRYGGAKENFMSLLAKAEAPYVMFCDQDDVWLPEKIELSITKMRELEGEFGADVPFLVFSDMIVVDDRLNTISSSFEQYSSIDPARTNFRQMLAQNVGAGCTMMCNSPLHALFKKTPKGEFMIMHDWWLALVASAFGIIAHIDAPLSLYRQHSDNAVGAVRYSAIENMQRLFDMRDRFCLTLKQAESFYRVYGKSVSPEDYAGLVDYCSILYSNRMRSLYTLFSSGCWKKGLRKLGQIVSIVMGTR